MPVAPLNPSTSRDLPATGRLSCVLVEDQSMFADLLHQMLRLRTGLTVLARAASVAEGLAICDLHRPALLIVDLGLPDGCGTDVARRAIELNPATRVIVISAHTLDFVQPAWLNDNMQAVVSKNDTFHSLQRELDELLGVAKPAAAGGIGKPLSPREAEIFALVGAGMTSRDIGARLSLSEHTVHTHRKRIAAKLGTQGDDLVRRAIELRKN